MKLEDLKLISGENSFQIASIERNENTIDYETSVQLTYTDILALAKGLNVASEFYDVNAAIAVKSTGIIAVALGKSIADAVTKIMDSNPVDFMSSTIVLTKEKEEVVLIGDSIHDGKAAKETGIDFIGVTYGFGFKSKDDMKEYNPVLCPESVQDIIDFFKKNQQT